MPENKDDKKPLPPTIQNFFDSDRMKGQPLSYEEFQHDGGVKSRICYYPEGKRGFIAALTTDKKPMELDHNDLISLFLDTASQLKQSMGLSF